MTCVRFWDGRLWLNVHEIAEVLELAYTEVGRVIEQLVEAGFPEACWLDGKNEWPCYPHTYVFEVGLRLESPRVARFASWASQQLVLGAAMVRACEVEPLEASAGEWAAPGEERDWLEDWRNAEEQVLFEGEGRKLERVLTAHWLRKPLRFIYWGGSESGQPRDVVPKRVFRREGYRSVWFCGYCAKRESDRTFNLEKVELVD